MIYCEDCAVFHAPDAPCLKAGERVQACACVVTAYGYYYVPVHLIDAFRAEREEGLRGVA